jgi:bifunctional DNase/RNase
MKRVALAGLAVESTSGTPLVLLREEVAPHRVVPIFIGAPDATAIAMVINGQTPPRPLSHDLMASLVDTLDGQLEAVEVTELSGGTFIANVALHGPSGNRCVDARPSDGIALALRLGAPLFVSEAVLDEAGTVPQAEIDEADIEETVDEFRSFLQGLDPSEFGDRN